MLRRSLRSVSSITGVVLRLRSSWDLLRKRKVCILMLLNIMKRLSLSQTQKISPSDTDSLLTTSRLKGTLNV
jgi:hypothetical protein